MRVTARFFRVQAVPTTGSGNTFTVTFLTNVGQNDYTASDVATLAGVVGKTLVLSTLDGSLLAGDVFPTWDDTTFSIPNYVTILGNERVVAQFI